MFIDGMISFHFFIEVDDRVNQRNSRIVHDGDSNWIFDGRVRHHIVQLCIWSFFMLSKIFGSSC